MKELKVNISDELYEQLFTNSDKGSLLLKLLEKELDISIEPLIAGLEGLEDPESFDLDETLQVDGDDRKESVRKNNLSDSGSLARADIDISSSDPFDPSADVDDPSTDSADPSDVAEGPSSDPFDPSADVDDPSTDSADPSDVAEGPSSDPFDPSADVDDPSTDSADPSDVAEGPSSDLFDPSADVDDPSTDSADPSDVAEGPSSDPFDPSADVDDPSTDSADSSDVAEGPSSGHVSPEIFEDSGRESVPEDVPLVKCDDMSFIYGALMGMDERLHGIEDQIREFRAILIEMKKSSEDFVKPVDNVDHSASSDKVKKVPYKVLSFPGMDTSGDQSSIPVEEFGSKENSGLEGEFSTDLSVNDITPIDDNIEGNPDPSLPFPELDISAINDDNPSIDPFRSDDLDLSRKTQTSQMFSADIISSDDAEHTEDEPAANSEKEINSSGFMQDPLKASILTYLPYGSLVKKQVIITLLSKRYKEEDVDARIDRMLSEGIISNIVKDDTVYLTRITGSKSTGNKIS